MKRVVPVVFIIFLILLVIANGSSTRPDITDGKKFRLVYCKLTSTGDFGFMSKRSRMILMGFDSHTGNEHVILQDTSHYGRPMITYKGDRVVFSSPDDSSLNIVDWNGTNKRKIAKAFAGCLWIDPVSGKEYAICALGCEYKGIKNDVYRINIDDPNDTAKLLSNENYNEINPQFLGISKDGKYVGGLFGWPTCQLYNIEKGKIVLSTAGCWPSVPYDTSQRFILFETSHSNIFKTLYPGGSQRQWTFVPQGREPNSYYVDFPRLAVYNPNYITYVDEGESGEGGHGPGDVVLAKLGPNLDTIIARVTIAKGQYGFPDAWIEPDDSTPKSPIEPVPPDSKKSVWLTIISPQGGEQWPNGSSQNIIWESSDNIDTVDIFYSLDGAKTWIKIATVVNKKSFNLTVPDKIRNDKVFLKICSHNNTNVCGQSNNPFQIGGSLHNVLHHTFSAADFIAEPIYIHAANGILSIETLSSKQFELKVILYGVNGQKAATFDLGMIQRGRNSFRVIIPPNILGTYICKIIGGGSGITKRITIWR